MRVLGESSEVLPNALAGLGQVSGRVLDGDGQVAEHRGQPPGLAHASRILGVGDLWITEFVLTYDGTPSYTVSIMEFKDGMVARETQYFSDAFAPGPSRAQWVERM